MRRVICLAVALPLLASVPAAAQGLTSGGIAGNGFKPITGVGPKYNKQEAPPPGLPGAAPRASAPPAELQLDVPPTEALFDAINRGDLGSARAALNRGADIYGRNVLGMTPLDLSVDLSRNDITFLLMSMRSQAAVSGPPSAPPPSAPVKGKGRAVAATTRVPAKRPEPPVATVSSPTPAVRYASVPDTPVPQAGFLGFGGAATP